VAYAVTVVVVCCSVAAFVIRDRANRKSIAIKDSYLDTLTEQVKNTERRMKIFLTEGRKISTLGSRSIADTEFLDKIVRIAEEPDMAFLIDAVHRGVYEAILTAPTDEMVLNAAGKGKGIRMLEKTMMNPVSIFGGVE
jgi:hypothetical protein